MSSNLDDMKDVSDRIRTLRRDLRLTQEELGKAAGVTKSAVSQWERGTSVPGRDALLSLRNKFGINPDWVMTGQGPMRIGRASTAQRAIGLLPTASPRSRELLEEIIEAAESGRLTEEDLKLLDQIAKRLSRS